MDGFSNNTMLLRQHTATPNLVQYAGSFGNDDAGCTISVFKLLTLVYDGANSLLIVNNSTATSSSIGTSSPGGMLRGASASGSLPSSITVKRIIGYSVNHGSTLRGQMWTYFQTTYGL